MIRLKIQLLIYLVLIYKRKIKEAIYIRPQRLTLMSRNVCNGENGETGDLNWMPKVAPWRLAILAKIAMHAMAKMAKLAKNHQPLAI